MKTENILTIGALIAGGYVVYQLTQPLKDTTQAVGGAVGGIAESFGGAVSAPLNVFEQGFGVLGDALAGLRSDSASQFQALQEQVYKQGIAKGREESSNYYTTEDLNKRQTVVNVLNSTPSGKAYLDEKSAEMQERGLKIREATEQFGKGQITSQDFNKIVDMSKQEASSYDARYIQKQKADEEKKREILKVVSQQLVQSGQAFSSSSSTKALKKPAKISKNK